MMIEEEKLCIRLSNLDVSIREYESGAFLATLQVEPGVLAPIRDEQTNDDYLQIVCHELEETGSEYFRVTDDGLLSFKGHICVPAKEEVRHRLMTEAHKSVYNLHPGIIKIYHDMCEISGPYKDPLCQCLIHFPFHIRGTSSATFSSP